MKKVEQRIETSHILLDYYIQGRRTRVPKVPFCFFDKLKHKIRNKVLILLKLRQKTSK